VDKVEQWIGTQDQWLASASVEDLLRTIFFLTERKRLCISERKWVLMMVACLRRIQHVLQDPRSTWFLDAIEQYGEGLLSRAEVDRVGLQTVTPPNSDDLSEIPKEQCPAAQLQRAYAWDALMAAGPPLQGYRFPFDFEKVAGGAAMAADTPEQEVCIQASLIRDIIGNPFHATVVEATWKTFTVANLAKSMYASKAFVDLPVLADALEEVGCDDTAILLHCRGPGPHVRGCWVVDLLMGRS
jgi:hypothetical protein